MRWLPGSLFEKKSLVIRRIQTAGRVLLLLLYLTPATAQQPPFFSLVPADSLHPGRFWAALGTGTVAYGAAMAGLYHTWYADYPSGPFHTFDDAAQWNQMDKMGHGLMAYHESRWIYSAARWTGIAPQKSAWLGFAGGQLIQTSIELLDGFSTEWGFSWTDMGANLLGSGLFLGQQLGWQEQRILLKMSAWPVRYPGTRIYPESPSGNTQWTTLQQRADALYGTGPVSLFLKNYNTLAVWLSVNPASFLPQRPAWLPRWLNLAVGFGADNLFAGTGYTWQADKSCSGPDCLRYRLNPVEYPRTRQYFLSLDVDFSHLGVKSRFLKAVLGMVNILKFPAPALELNSRGNWRFHPLYF
ncbi:MAG: DUF2279 domain-containing protein [Lewinellaceae bacterium]|nr:DUF2279 domain-containing protein [Lewinellaceae bacterium]